ncbi:MAG TPA: hypothetical protein DEA78_15615 [Cyanobacteria bacterium UBA11159]|nr:hypothetical protein [Cyanobacteria bacterium UBA11366]HBK64907.1 hypothetical protein [Cyanobacteria bacterium UBA11166]HBR75089.1 hypothetical protein [Cyanobacteria bacterium UBA11159]
MGLFWYTIIESSKPTLKTMKNPSSAINIVNLEHLGIVAVIIDEMKLVDSVNKIVGIIVRAC